MAPSKTSCAEMNGNHFISKKAFRKFVSSVWLVLTFWNIFRKRQRETLNSKHLTPTFAYLQLRAFSSLAVAWLHVASEICKQKPKKSTNENVRCLWGWFQVRSSPWPVVALALPQTKKGRWLVAAQSFGICIIFTWTISFSSYADQTKKEHEQK